MTTNLSEIRIEPVQVSRLPGVDLGNVPFSSVFSDHMLVAEYRDGAWGQATIRAYGPLSLAPSISALQYAVSVFEGLKAHRMPTGEFALFRPRENARRLNRSALRLAMPEVPEALFLEGLRRLVHLDQKWVPAAAAGALYVRPCYFSVDESIRPKPAERYLFVIFTFPFGAYFPAPVDVLVTERYVRAFPGGTGDVKPAGNYAPALLADKEARDSGLSTVLWLDARERRYVEECGVMNVFFVLADRGGPRVVTPELSGTILPGVTRDSVLTLLRETGVAVEERRVSIDELLAAHGQGTLRECFGTGTAATLSHVRRIRYRDRDYELPPVEARAIGPAVREQLVAIATGRAPDRHGWLERL
ncbi:MAG: branched-chain amino acid aminotransferase [Thermoanaerobaculia bacterium]